VRLARGLLVGLLHEEVVDVDLLFVVVGRRGTLLLRRGRPPAWPAVGRCWRAGRHLHPLGLGRRRLALGVLVGVLILGRVRVCVRVIVAAATGGHALVELALLAALGFHHLLEEGKAEEFFGRHRVRLVDLLREPGLGVRGRETDERLERARRQRRRPLRVRCEVVIAERGVDRDDVVGRALREDGQDPVLGVLDVLFNERDREDLLLLIGAPARRGRDAAVEEGVVLLEDGRLEP